MANDVQQQQPGAEAGGAGEVIDPVCGMTVTLGIGKPCFGYQGETYHFCGQCCHDRFAATTSSSARRASSL